VKTSTRMEGSVRRLLSRVRSTPVAPREPPPRAASTDDASRDRIPVHPVILSAIGVESGFVPDASGTRFEPIRHKNTSRARAWRSGLGCLGCLVAMALSGGAESPGWQSLFNGKDLSGWVPLHGVTFEANDGNLRLVRGMGWLRSEREYGDFILEFECRALVEKYDSGIFFRAGLEGEPWPREGWQLNLRYDAIGGLVKGSQIVEPAPTARIPVNHWMSFRLEVRGRKTVLTVDGEEGWSVEKLDRTRGYIGIQAEDRAFDFRNLRIREL